MVGRPPPAPHAPAPLRVLLCKSGLDEHDRGVRYVMRKLMEAGMEVVYLVFHDPGEVAAAALQEDVAVIGLSSFVLGGIIPDADRTHIEDLGVVGVFGPGADPADIVATIRNSAGLT